jgi:hypothetical protein
MTSRGVRRVANAFTSIAGVLLRNLHSKAAGCTRILYKYPYDEPSPAAERVSHMRRDELPPSGGARWPGRSARDRVVSVLWVQRRVRRPEGLEGWRCRYGAAAHAKQCSGASREFAGICRHCLGETLWRNRARPVAGSLGLEGQLGSERAATDRFNLQGLGTRSGGLSPFPNGPGAPRGFIARWSPSLSRLHPLQGSTRPRQRQSY